MFDRFDLPFFDFPVRFSGSGYTDAQLVIDPPMLRKSIVFWMINRDLNSNSFIVDVPVYTVQEATEGGGTEEVEYLIKENSEFKGLIMELVKKDNTNVVNNNIKSVIIFFII